MFPPHPVQQWWTLALCTKDTSKLKCGHDEPNGPKTWPHPAVTEGVVAVSGGQWSSILETKERELFKKGYKSQLRCVKKRYEHAKIIKTKGFVWELGNNMSTQTPNNKVDKGAKPSNGRANTPHLIDQTPLTARLHLEFKPDQHGGLFRNWSLFISTRWKILWTRTVTDTPPKHDATTTVRYCEGCN